MVGAGAVEDGRPVHGDAVQMGAGHRREDLAGLGGGTPAQGDRRGGGQAVLGHGGQDAVGSDLDEGGDSGGVQVAQGVVEENGVADVAHPVAGVADLVRCELPARQGGHQRDARRPRLQGGGDGREVGEHAVHVRGVEGVADPQPAGLPAPVGAGAGETVDGVGVPGHDGGGGAVDGGQVESADRVGTVEQFRHPSRGGPDGEHGSAARQGLHQPAPGGDELAGVGQGEHSGDVRGGEFADGVARDDVRLEAPALQQPEQGDLEGEEGRLGVDRAVQVGVVVGEEDLAQGAVGVRGEGRVERGAQLVERGAEHRPYGVQFAAHGRPLAALAGEEVGDAAATGGAAQDAGGGGVVGERGEAREQGGGDGVRPAGRRRGGQGGEDGGAVLEGGARGGECPGDVDGRQLPTGLREVGVQAAGLGAQGGGAAAGQQEGEHADGGDRCGGGLRGRGCAARGFGDDDVGVGAAHPEGADAGDQPSPGVRPRPVLTLDAQAQFGEGDGVGGGAEVEAAGQFAVLDAEQCLDQAGDSGGALQVAHIGLGGADAQPVLAGPAGAEGRAEGRRLDGVAEPGSGAVQFHVLDVAGGDAGAVAGQAQQVGLSVGAGGGEGAGGAVVVDGAAQDHAEDPVAVVEGVREPLEQDDAAALAAYVAVRAGVEGVAAAGR